MKNLLKYILSIVLVLLVIFFGCKEDKKGVSNTTQTEKKQYKIPAFNGDSAYVFVKNQVDFGPRVPGTEAHKKAIEYFVKKFEGYGAKVEKQNFKAKFVLGFEADATNIIAHMNPGKSKKIIIAAHFDSRKIAEKDPDESMRDKPIDGADDGASGVGIILELARLMKENQLDLSVDFILFDAEDNGDDSGSEDTWCLGSQYWSKEAKKVNYKADFGFLFDLVGAKGAVYPKEGYSIYYAGDIQNKLWNLAAGMGYGDLFANVERGYITDDHVYVNRDAGIRMVDIINIPNDNGSFGFYHHTHSDNMDIIDINTLRRTGQVLLAFMFKYANGDL